MVMKMDFDWSQDLVRDLVMHRSPNYYKRHQEGSWVKILGQ